MCVCVMAECPEGRFGPDCVFQCSCVNNSTCDGVTGACQCEAGYYGHLCEHGEIQNTQLKLSHLRPNAF